MWVLFVTCLGPISAPCALYNIKSGKIILLTIFFPPSKTECLNSFCNVIYERTPKHTCWKSDSFSSDLGVISAIHRHTFPVLHSFKPLWRVRNCKDEVFLLLSLRGISRRWTVFLSSSPFLNRDVSKSLSSPSSCSRLVIWKSYKLSACGGNCSSVLPGWNPTVGPTLWVTNLPATSGGIENVKL